LYRVVPAWKATVASPATPEAIPMGSAIIKSGR
jgi:hypothetical protein